MNHAFRKFALAASVAGAIAAAGAPSVYAAGPHLSPPNTTVTASTNLLTFVGTIDGVKLTIHCTGLNASGKTPANGLTIKLPQPPVFSGCSDSTGNTDTITTSGSWSISANSTGSKVTLHIPKAGATFVSNFLPSCTIIVAPNGATTISGKYDNVNKWTITKAAFAVGAQGNCTSGKTATATSTLTFSPNVSVVA